MENTWIDYETLMIDELQKKINEIGYVSEIIDDKEQKHISIGFFLDREEDKEYDIPYEILLIPNKDLKIINIVVPNICVFKEELLEYKEFHKLLNMMNTATIVGNIFYVEFKERKVFSINYSHGIFCANKDNLDSEDLIEISLYINHLIEEIYDEIIDNYREFKQN